MKTLQPLELSSFLHRENKKKIKETESSFIKIEQSVLARKKNEAKEITRVVSGLKLARPRESLLLVSIWDRDLTIKP